MFVKDGSYFVLEHGFIRLGKKKSTMANNEIWVRCSCPDSLLYSVWIYDVSYMTMFQLMSKYYMDNAALVWNGNGRTGADEIQKFLASLPITTYTLTSQDVQRIPGTGIL